QAMQAILDKAQPLFEVIWRLDTEGRSLETPERRAALEQALTERVAQIQDATVRFHYQRLVRDRLWQTLRPPRPKHERSFAQGRSGQRNSRFGQASRPAMSEGGAAKVYMPAVNHLERVLLAVVLTHPNLLDHLGERLGTIHFSDLELDKLRQEVLKHLGAGPDLDSEVLQSHLRSCGFSRALDSLLGINFLSMEPFLRSSAPAERALSRWEDAFKLYQQKDMTADILRAENCLAKDVSNESWERYLALKQQAQDNDWDDGETPA
ncbi:MAG: DNA primase, partial [Rhodospirillales bacterium]|nr:DNA primase [Rhodospirillales bacterium]